MTLTPLNGVISCFSSHLLTALFFHYFPIQFPRHSNWPKSHHRPAYEQGLIKVLDGINQCCAELCARQTPSDGLETWQGLCLKYLICWHLLKCEVEMSFFSNFLNFLFRIFQIYPKELRIVNELPYVTSNFNHHQSILCFLVSNFTLLLVFFAKIS